MDFLEFLGNAGQGLIDLGKGFLGAVGKLVDSIVDPIADALGVHSDVIKVAAAALGMYYAEGAGFFDAATGAAVSEATAADLVAAQGAEALAAGGNYEAAINLANATNPAAAPGIATKAAYLAQNPGVAYESLQGPMWSWPTATAPAAAIATPVATSPLATMGAATPAMAADIAALGAESLAVPTTNALAPATAAAGAAGAANALTAADLATAKIGRAHV